MIAGPGVDTHLCCKRGPGQGADRTIDTIINDYQLGAAFDDTQ